MQVPQLLLAKVPVIIPYSTITLLGKLIHPHLCISYKHYITKQIQYDFIAAGLVLETNTQEMAGQCIVIFWVMHTW